MMGFHLKTISSTFLAVLAVTISFVCYAEEETLKIGIVLDTHEPLKVQYVDKNYIKSGQIAAALGGLIGGLILDASMEKRNSTYSARLIVSAGNSVDRFTELKADLVSEFHKQNPRIELIFLPSDLVSKEGKIDFIAIEKKMTPYVVVVREKAGLATPASKWGSLAAHCDVDLSVYNVETTKRMLKEKIDAVGASNDNIDNSLDVPDTFKNGYPIAARSVSHSIYWRLSGRDILNSIAKNTALESEFPSINALLTENAKRFDFVRPIPPKDWNMPKTGSAYLYRIEPKKDKKVFGIVSDIDLLVKEFGQDFETLAPYIELRLSRLADIGWDVSGIKDVPILVFDEDWQVYMLPEPLGGYSIFLHKKYVDFVVTHQIIILENDPIPLLKKHQKNIQDYVNGSKLVFK